MKFKTVYRDRNIRVRVQKHPPTWGIWVRPAANLLPVTKAGKILLMHEYKRGSRQWIWGFPGGIIEPGETAARAANRECQEELGLKASRLRKVVVVKTTFPETSVSYFLGFDLRKAEKKNWERIGSIKELSIAQLIQLALDGKIHDPRMVVAVLRLGALVKRGRIKLRYK